MASTTTTAPTAMPMMAPVDKPLLGLGSGVEFERGLGEAFGNPLGGVDRTFGSTEREGAGAVTVAGAAVTVKRWAVFVI